MFSYGVRRLRTLLAFEASRAGVRGVRSSRLKPLVWVGGGEFEACIKLSSSAIGSCQDGFVALDFKEDDFPCPIFWVHEDCNPQRWTFSMVDLK